MEQPEIRVLLVDHQEMVRCGLQRLLNDMPGLHVVGEASTGEELSLIHISEPTRRRDSSRMPSSA